MVSLINGVDLRILQDVRRFSSGGLEVWFFECIIFRQLLGGKAWSYYFCITRIDYTMTKQKSILIVDDNPGVISALKLLL